MAHRTKLTANRRRIAVQIADLKLRLARDIKRILDSRNLTQTEASYMTGEAASQISLVYTGKLRGFSMERLLRMRAMLGAEIHLDVTASTIQCITHNFR